MEDISTGVVQDTNRRSLRHRHANDRLVEDQCDLTIYSTVTSILIQ